MKAGLIYIYTYWNLLYNKVECKELPAYEDALGAAREKERKQLLSQVLN